MVKQKESIEPKLLNDYKQSQLFNLFHGYHQKQDEEHYIVTAHPTNNKKAEITPQTNQEKLSKAMNLKTNQENINGNTEYRSQLNTHLTHPKTLTESNKLETKLNTKANPYENTAARALSEKSPHNQVPVVFGNEHVNFQEQKPNLDSKISNASTENPVQEMRYNTENAHVGPNIIQNNQSSTVPRNVNSSNISSNTTNTQTHKSLDSIDESLPFSQRVITPSTVKTKSKNEINSNEAELYSKVKESVTTAEWLRKANSFAVETSKKIKELPVKRIKLLSLEDNSKSSILLDDLLLHYLASIIIGKNLDIFLIFRDTTIITIAPSKWLESNNISKKYLLDNGYKYSYESLDIQLLIESLKPFCSASSVTDQTTQLWLKFVPILSR